MRRARVLTLILFALAAVPLGVAYGQYPQPIGACTISGPASLTPGQSAVYTVTALDTNGDPKAGQSGTVTISPAGAATATPSAFVTGADGKASITVKAGANAASVSVAITCGPLSGGSSITIASGVTPKPPDTGTGATADESGFPVLWVALGIAGLGIAGGTYAVARRRS
jgi:T5SS/PEP-CTERM-associated repeat protein